MPGAISAFIAPVVDRSLLRVGGGMGTAVTDPALLADMDRLHARLPGIIPPREPTVAFAAWVLDLADENPPAVPVTGRARCGVLAAWADPGVALLAHDLAWGPAWTEVLDNGELTATPTRMTVAAGEGRLTRHAPSRGVRSAEVPALHVTGLGLRSAALVLAVFGRDLDAYDERAAGELLQQTAACFGTALHR